MKLCFFFHFNLNQCINRKIRFYCFQFKKNMKRRASDLSSADEESRRRVQNKVKCAKTPIDETMTFEHRSSLENLQGVAQMLKIPKEEMPKLATLEQLVAEHIHLKSSTDCQVAAGKKINQSGAVVELTTGKSNPKLHKQQASINPYQIQAFLLKRSNLPVPRFYCPSDKQHSLSQEELQRQLSDNKLQLCCLEADFESALLAEAKPTKLKDCDGVLRQFPLCRYKDKCVGSTVKIRGLNEKIVLTALMFPHEYDKFLLDGTCPRVDRPCILCCRWILVDWDITCRDLLMRGKKGHVSQSSSSSWHMKSTQIMQLFYNVMDRPGGYFSQYCLTPNAREPMIQPMVRLNRLLLTAHKHNDRWYINQDALVWKAPVAPEPLMGESVKHF